MIPDESRKLFREPRSVKTWLQMLLDQVVVQSLLIFHTYTTTNEFPVEYRILAVLSFLLMALIYKAVGVYQHERARNDYISCLTQAWGMLVLVLAVFGFVTRTSETYSREVILMWTVTGFIGQILVYWLIRLSSGRVLVETIPTLLVGGTDLGRHVSHHINQNPWIADHVIGYVDDLPPPPSQGSEDDLPRLGGFDEVNRIVAANNVRRVYIALPMEQIGLVKPLASELVEASIDVIWAPDIFGVSLVNHSIREVAGVPLISLSETPLTGGPALAKSVMDKVIASIALVLASPIMVATAIAIKLTSPGPILFIQKRHGWDGRIVEVYKFRSMVSHTEPGDQVTQATKDDQRVTPVGRFIRRTSIDELPQLFNVLGGSMSLVGPRPHAVAHNEFYRNQIQAYMLRHRIKPGLTGLAQVNGFRGETETIDKMRRRVSYDLAYINNWSIWLDIEILFKTVFVLFGKNVY